MSKKTKILTIVLFFLALSLNSLEAQNKVFLQSGPLPCAGMPGIGLNSIPGYSGIYIFPEKKADISSELGYQEHASFTVYFSEKAIPVFSSWKKVATYPNTIYETESETIYIYIHSENWTFFIDFHIKENISLSFVENIVKQMIYFAKDGSTFVNASFPAIIDY